jgi:hypothetical protein
MNILRNVTAAGLLLLAACGQKNNTKPPEQNPNKVETKPASTPTTPETKPADKVEPTAQSTCRALVNLTLPDGPGVADVKIAATSTLETGRGAYVMVADSQTFAVQLAKFSVTDKNKIGSLIREWDEISITPIPGGTAKIVSKFEPEVVLPDADSMAPEFDMQVGLSISSLIGPYLSLSVGASGFTGGAHGYDDSHYVTLKMPDGAAFPLDALKTEAMAEITAKIAKDDEARRAEVGEDAEKLPIPEQFTQWSFALGEEGQPGLFANHLLSCCTWVENHNLHELDVQLSKVPSVLQSHLTLSADNKWIEAPNGCGAVSIEGNTVKVRAGKDGATQDLGQAGQVVGVYWVDEKNAFSAKSLPTPIAKVTKDNPGAP